MCRWLRDSKDRGTQREGGRGNWSEDCRHRLRQTELQGFQMVTLEGESTCHALGGSQAVGHKGFLGWSQKGSEAESHVMEFAYILESMDRQPGKTSRFCVKVSM